MRKFIIRGVCFAGLGLILLVVLNALYIRTNGYRCLDEMYKFYLMPENIEVANLGSSHGAFGIYYEGVSDIKGFNFALPGQSLYYDLKMLERYGDTLANGCVVIIPLSYFSFDQKTAPVEQNRWYYKILGYNSVTDHSMADYIRYGLLPFLSASFNAKYLINDKDNMAFDIYWIYKFLGFKLEEEDVEGWRQNARDSLDYYKKITGHGENIEFNMTCLEMIIEYCRENGLKPVLITMPFTKFYHDVFPEDILKEFHAKVNEVKERYDVTYIDYSQDERITENLGLFSDTNHMNMTGREVFTRILLSDLGLI